jgi:hypothetical protein
VFLFGRFLKVTALNPSGRCCKLNSSVLPGCENLLFLIPEEKQKNRWGQLAADGRVTKEFMSQDLAVENKKWAELPLRRARFRSLFASIQKAVVGRSTSGALRAHRRKWWLNRWRGVDRALPVFLGVLIFATAVSGQQSSHTTVVDTQTLETLLQRIDQLETRVKQLEADKQTETLAGTSTAPPTHAAPTIPAEGGHEQIAPTSSTAAPAPTSVPAKEGELPQLEIPFEDRMDLNRTLLRIRGFGDMSLNGSTEKGDTTSFSLGQLNLFVTSDISEKFKFLTELVFEAGPITNGQLPNTYAVDVERMLLRYSYNNYFNLMMGRNHTSIGYYNTAYHDSAWFQTAIAPPYLYTYEDRGGILPIHIVGVSASGMIPSGSLGLHYVAEVGNGRASLTPDDEPVQKIYDENNHKAVNVALFSRPRKVPGLQVGFSWYNDLLTPAEQPKITENIFAGYAVIERHRFEWLTEGLLIRHAPAGANHVFYTPGFYTLVSEKFGHYQPYFGFQYINASDQEPVFPFVGWQQGPYMGLRYNANESVAVKFQYGYTAYSHAVSVNSLALQVAFTF